MRSDDARQLILIGPLPPPAVGQSVSFRMLCTELAKKHLALKVLDIGGSSIVRKDGAFSLARVVQFVHPFGKLAGCLFRKNCTVYLTIAQSWNGFLRDFVFITLASIGRCRIIVHLKGGNYDGFYNGLGRGRRLMVRLLLSRVAVIIVLAECLRSQFDFIPSKSDAIKVVHNGLPEDLAIQGPPKILPRDLVEPIRILFLSNLIESKGYLLVLDAVANLVKTLKTPIVATFCGEFLLSADTTLYKTTGEARTDFFRRVETLGISNAIEYRGPVLGNEKKNVLEHAHFFVLPTSYINEGQPVSIIEAMAYGCVVISTDFRSIPEMLDFGNAGVILEKCGGAAIAGAISELVNQPDRYARLSIAAMQRFEKCFSKDAHVANMLKILLPRE